MWLLNRCLNTVTDALLTPWSSNSPWVALSVASVLTSALLVTLFHFSSDQQALQAARNRFVARLMELLLFQHDVRVNLSACGRILHANFCYLATMVRPLLVATLPFALIFIQLAGWFEWRPLRPGEAVVLKVRLNDALPVTDTVIDVSIPSVGRLDSPAVRTPGTNEVAWRIRATAIGTEMIAIRVAKTVELKQLTVGTQLARISPLRTLPSFWNELWDPSEPPLATDGPITRIEITYPQRQLTIGEYEIHWTMATILLMTAWGLILGRLCGVHIA